MSDLSVLSPNGWFNGWLSQAQIYPGYNGNPSNGLNQTVAAFSGGTNLDQAFPPGLDPANQLLLDGYMTYFGSGNVVDNRLGVLGKSDLVIAGKSPWEISKDSAQNFRPMLTVYLNDASTSESAFNLLTDINSSGGTSNAQSIPVNVMTNAALQIGAFLGARIWSANPQAGIKDPSTGDLTAAEIATLRALRNDNFITGDILLTPDGFGSFTKNYGSAFTGLTGAFNAVNSSSTNVGNSEYVKADLVQTADGKGWQIIALDGSVAKVIPGSVTIGTTTYTVQPKLVFVANPSDPSRGHWVPQLQDPSGNLYSDLPTDKPLWLRSVDQVNARQTLQDSLRYLRTLRDQYAGYGVIFPEVFYASDTEFNQFCNTLPGFSPAPGVQLPGLDPSLTGTVSDLLATQTYLAKLFAGPLNVAHVFNPWAVGSIDTAPYYLDSRMFQDNSTLLQGAKTASDVKAKLEMVAGKVKDKVTDLGWFKASPYMDYLAMDKYERDELSGTVNYGAYNAFNRNAWINFAYYANALSQDMRTGPGSATAQGAPIDNGGNTDLLYYQIPAASLAADLATNATGPFVNGLGDLASTGDEPHFSMAFDSFFGNPDLKNKADFITKYPELSGLMVNVYQAGNPYAELKKVNLADYLFSPSANALEDAGLDASGNSRDVSQGLLSITNGQATVNRDMLGDLFGIVWGGGNTSTPFAYLPAQWGKSTATWTNGPSLTTTNAPNSQGVVPLGNTVNNLAKWGAADYEGPTGESEVSVRSLGLRYAAIKTDASGQLSLAVCSQAGHRNSIYLYKLSTPSATPEIDAITGATLNDNRPDAASAQSFFEDVTTNNIKLPVTLSTATAGLGKGIKLAPITVDPNSYYGILLQSDSDAGETSYSTSYAAAGTWDGTTVSDRAIPAAALVDASELGTQFFGGSLSFANSRVLGFEDNIVSDNTDFDYNDSFLGVTAGGTIVI